MSYNSYIETILSNLPNSIYWKDSNGVYLGANIHAAHMVGLTSVSDLIGKTDYDLTSKDKADQFRKNDFIVLSTGKELCIEESSVSKDSVELVELSTKKPIKDKVGNIIGIMGVTVDITDLKIKEKMLWDQTKSLEEALSAKKRFFNSLSHEIRTPIHIINSIAEELYTNFDHFSKEESKSFLGTLLQNSSKLKELVQNLLEIAKNNQGKSYYCFEKRNIVSIIRETISEFATIATISFNTKHEKITCNIDILKIGQVIRNLLDNAIKYGDSKSIVLELSKSNPKQNVTIQVKNKGAGILEKEHKKVFEPFFRGSNVPTNLQGCGLGLSICKEIITAHKGKFSINKDSLDMTSVNFTIPYIE
jgi:two-component system aerobic respiration control sensor histidine kinase ArcB